MKSRTRQIRRRLEAKRLRQATKNALRSVSGIKGVRSRNHRRAPQPPAEEFTGTCLVKTYTGDGDYFGRCYHSTYDGVCHFHGDVSAWLGARYAAWPSELTLFTKGKIDDAI